jgi:hypothetical protein
MDAGARLTRARSRTTKARGPDSSTPESSRRKRSFADDGDKKARSPGRVRHKSLKPFARGMPGATGVTVVTMLVCFFQPHTRLRARWTPGIPCALSLEGRRIFQGPGRQLRRGNVASCVARGGSKAQACAGHGVFERSGNRFARRTRVETKVWSLGSDFDQNRKRL